MANRAGTATTVGGAIRLDVMSEFRRRVDSRRQRLPMRPMDRIGMKAVLARHLLSKVTATNNRSLSGNAMQPRRSSEGLHRHREDQQP
jgi:hypothetical protein